RQCDRTIDEASAVGARHAFLQPRERHAPARSGSRRRDRARRARDRDRGRPAHRQGAGRGRGVPRFRRQSDAARPRHRGGAHAARRRAAAGHRRRDRRVRLSDGTVCDGRPRRPRRELAHAQGAGGEIRDRRSAVRSRAFRTEDRQGLLSLRGGLAHAAARSGSREAHRRGLGAPRHCAPSDRPPGNLGTAALSNDQRGRANPRGGNRGAARRHRHHLDLRLRLAGVARRPDVLRRPVGASRDPRQARRDRGALEGCAARACAAARAPRHGAARVRVTYATGASPGLRLAICAERPIISGTPAITRKRSFPPRGNVMDLRFTDEELAFRDEVREFMRAKLPEKTRQKIIEGRHLDKDDIVNWQRILNEKGWAVPNWPVEWGGQDWTPVQQYIWLDELQQAPAPSPLPFNVSMVGPVIAQFGNEAQKKKFLQRCANLDDWWCQGFSEPGAGSDLASLKTSAKREGDHYVVNGQKTWTTLAQYADWIF